MVGANSGLCFRESARKWCARACALDRFGARGSLRGDESARRKVSRVFARRSEQCAARQLLYSRYDTILHDTILYDYTDSIKSIGAMCGATTHILTILYCTIRYYTTIQARENRSARCAALPLLYLLHYTILCACTGSSRSIGAKCGAATAIPTILCYTIRLYRLEQIDRRDVRRNNCYTTTTILYDYTGSSRSICAMCGATTTILTILYYTILYDTILHYTTIPARANRSA